MLATLALRTSSALASTLVALEEPFGLPLYCGNPLWAGPGRSRLPLLARRCGGRGASRSQGCAWCSPASVCPRARTQGPWPQAVKGVAPRPTAAESAPGPPAALAQRCCARILTRPQLPPRGAGLRTYSLPCLSPHSTVGSRATKPPPMGTAPYSVAPDPRTEECRYGSGLVGSSSCSSDAGSTE